MGAGRNFSYNPRTGKWARPRPWYEKTRKSRTRNSRKKKGCYVATAVYGSYDCPEVWTLRRYRDNYLAKNLFGRLFIRGYYLTSPVIVKLFGKTQWFNRIFKKHLDLLVEKLNAHGYSSDRYEDSPW